MVEKKRASGINKKDLTEQLASQANIPKVRAAEYINILTNIISDALQSGRKVTISDFGTFNLSERTAFQGYDPRNEKRIQVPRRVIPVFRAGKQLKNSLNLPQIKKCFLNGTKQIEVMFSKLIDIEDPNIFDASNYHITANRSGNCKILSVEKGISENETRKSQKDKVQITGIRSIRLNCSHHLYEGGYSVTLSQQISDVDGNITEGKIIWPKP